MATYNGELYIRDQIESILNQIGVDDEVVISDDGSVDSTLDIIASFKDARINVIASLPCGNPILSFEKAISAALGDVIVLSDQDDIWLDGRIDIIRRHFLGRETEYLTVSLDSCVVDKQLNTIYPSLFTYLNAGPGLIKNVIRNGYVGCHMIFTKRIRDVSLPFPKNIPMHDIWIGIVSEVYGDVVFDRSRTTMLFRRHGQNATKFGIPLSMKLKWRSVLIINLFRIIFMKYALFFPCSLAKHQNSLTK